MGNIKIKKEDCIIKRQYVYIPRAILVAALKQQVGSIKMQAPYLTRQDVEDEYFPYFKESGLLPSSLMPFLFLNANRNKTGKKTLSAYAKLLKGIKDLLDKYDAQMLNAALLIPKDASHATINYLKGILRNMEKQQNATEQPNTGKIRISPKYVTMDNVGTYVRGLSDKQRNRLAKAIRKSLKLEYEKTQFGITWQEWKQKKFANDYKHPTAPLRRLVVDFIKVQVFLKSNK